MLVAATTVSHWERASLLEVVRADFDQPQQVLLTGVEIDEEDGRWAVKEDYLVELLNNLGQLEFYANLAKESDQQRPP